MHNFDQARYLLHKKTRRRSRTYPLGTIADYGPDDRRATKVVVGIVDKQNNLLAMGKWFSEQDDARLSSTINQQHAASAVMVDRIIGCPHEEGIDYPLGGACPHCPFWKGKDRWSGLSVD
jgi:hypothetical protein